MSKPTLSAEDLRSMLIDRIEALPGMAGQVTDAHNSGVRWKEAGPGEPNWFVPLGPQRGAYRTEVARIIRQMQMEYDLDEE